MGDIGLYLLMILILVAIIGTIVLTCRWIKKIIRQIKRKQYFRALFTFALPVAVVGVVIYYIVPIVNTIFMILATIAVIGVMTSMKDNTIYYYSD